METILKLQNVRKKYGKKEVLKGIDLTVCEGEIISVLGPSGCGKSTLLNIIAGILPLEEGSVEIRGREVSAKSKMVPIEKRDINMVFQDFALWPHMKAKDNILYGLKVKKTEQEAMRSRLKEVESLLHLDGLLEQYPSELSGGQQQRVAIARALITNPSIILLDEPLCNLDVQLRIEMRTEMAQLFRQLKTTVFHVTHDPSEAFAMADRIIIMNGGVIDQTDTPENCYRSPQTATVAGLLGAGNCIEAATMSRQADSEGLAGVRLSDREICCKTYGNPKTGSKMLLKFRPEESMFVEEDGESRIPVRVVMSSFEGGRYRVKVETDSGDSFCLLHPSCLSGGQRGFAQISPERLYAYEKIPG